MQNRTVSASYVTDGTKGFRFVSCTNFYRIYNMWVQVSGMIGANSKCAITTNHGLYMLTSQSINLPTRRVISKRTRAYWLSVSGCV